MRKFFTILLSLFFAATAAATAQEQMDEINAEWMKAHYTKAEYMIPMRDGVRLYTAV